MTEKKVVKKKVMAKGEPVPMPTVLASDKEIEIEITTLEDVSPVEQVTEDAPVVAPKEEFCPDCQTLVHLCICRWRNNETFECECGMCPCMANVKREGAVCADCKEHDL